MGLGIGVQVPSGHSGGTVLTAEDDVGPSTLPESPVITQHRVNTLHE